MLANTDQCIKNGHNMLSYATSDINQTTVAETIGCSPVYLFIVTVSFCRHVSSADQSRVIPVELAQ